VCVCVCVYLRIASKDSRREEGGADNSGRSSGEQLCRA